MTHYRLTFFIIGLVLYAVSSLAGIWALNTLFNTNIPLSFKTWFAAVVLIFVMRYVVRRGEPYGRSYFDYFDDDDDEDEESEDDIDEEIEEPDVRAVRLGKLEERLRRFEEERKQNKGKR
jgi:hypothetical protein